MSSRPAMAEQFRRLHEDLLVLPNCWDPPSAFALGRAGAPAIATTSAGVAWSRGVPDGGGLSFDEALDAFARIAGAVDVPVSADVEHGYAEDPDEIAAHVLEFAGRGAVGVNIEDSVAGTVLPVSQQVAVLAAVRDAVSGAGVPLFVNARTDVFLAGGSTRTAEDLLAETIERAEAFRAAGADGLFVPGLGDRDLIRALCKSVDLRVNVGPVSTDRAELADLGVRRVSFGPTLAMAAYGATADRVAAVLRGEPSPPPTTRLNLAERWPG